MVAKKIYSLIVASCFFITSLFAQIPDSSFCPNFTGIDINGNRHTLYNYLDSGYTVFLDISTTWCPPCWDLHESGIFKKFHTQYGPNGTNKARVLFIEAEARNTLAQLQGITTDSTRVGLTYGNFTVGTLYPIIDDATIPQLLQVESYPTVYAIYPNRQIIHIPAQFRQLTIDSLTTQLANSIGAVGSNNLSIIQYAGVSQLTCNDKPLLPKLTLQNTGLDSIKSCEISFKVNNTVVETKVLTGLALKKYDTLMVNFNRVSVAESARLSFTILKVNNQKDTFNYRNSAEYFVLTGATVDTDSVIVEVKTDRTPEQTYWKIVGQSGVKIAEGGNPDVRPSAYNLQLQNAGNYKIPFNVYRHSVSLSPNTCYDVYLWDEFGNGLANNFGGSLGYLKILDKNNRIIYNLGYDTWFGEVKRIIERSNVVNVTTIENLSDLKLYPSPASEVLTLDFSLSSAKELTISVVNILGQTVKTLPKQLYTEEGNSVPINVENFENGVYFIHLKENRTSVVRKFIIQH